MQRFGPFLASLILALVVGMPGAEGFGIAAAALFRINPRKENEGALPAGFALLQAAPTAYILTNGMGVIDAANDAATTLCTDLGVACARGQHIRTVLASDPEAEPKIYRAVRGALDSGSTITDFAEAPGAAGLRVSTSRGGTADSVLWSLDPIGSEPLTEAAPTSLSTLEDAPIGFFSADRGGVIVSMNATLAQWLGVAWPSEKPLALSDILNDGARRLSPALAKIGETVIESASLHAPSGLPLRVQVVQALSEEGDGDAVTRSFVFPEVEKRDVEVGNTTGSRLVRFLDDAPVAVALTSTDGTIVEANDMLVEMSGGSARVGADVSVAVRRDDRKDVVDRIASIVDGSDPATPLEVKVTGDKGVEHEARFHAHTVSTDRGEMLLTYLIDVTEMKKIEHQLAQVQKMQAVGQLAGGIAHDVNNVLTAIRGHCDLLMLRHHEGDPDFEYLNQIRSQTERAAEVISQLLAYSRRQTMKRQVTQLTDMLDDMQFMLKHLTTERVNFTVQHARDLGLVRIDRSEFQRVVMNLAVNACHAMAEGGQLTMRTSNIAANDPIIDAYDVMTAQPYVQIEVIDTGDGIAAEHLQKIFEPFFTTKGQGQGTGLGLSTVYGIIKQMNGFIFCESTVGEGTNFRIFLPRYEGTLTVAEENPAPKKPLPNAKPRDLSGSGCVLLVEDEDAVRSFAVRALELRGYTVLAAAGGEEALEIVEEDPDAIDLIVSDVIMPGMTGPEMMRKVRDLRPDILFIFISGYAEDAFREEMLEDDNFRFLPKPFSLNDLAVKVKEALDG